MQISFLILGSVILFSGQWFQCHRLVFLFIFTQLDSMMLLELLLFVQVGIWLILNCQVHHIMLWATNDLVIQFFEQSHIYYFNPNIFAVVVLKTFIFLRNFMQLSNAVVFRLKQWCPRIRKSFFLLTILEFDLNTGILRIKCLKFVLWIYILYHINKLK